MSRPWFIFLGSILFLNSIVAQKTISVLYFDNTVADQDYQWLSKGLADMLISDLSGLSGIKIIEREALEKVLQEQALSLTGLTNEGSAAEVGKLLQADQLIYGGYIINDDRIRIDVKLVSVESGSILYAFDVKGDIEDIFELEAELISGFYQHFSLKGKSIPKIPETNSVDALARFYIGIDHLDHKRYTQAESEFSRAAELDPLFYRAQEGLAESYKFLKVFKKHRQQREIAQLYAKIQNLRERIETPQFFTFTDIVMSPQYQTLTPEQRQEWNRTHNEYMICNTPAQCTWNILLTLDEIGRKSVEYFNDTNLQKRMWEQVIQISEKARITYADDPFLSEILYIQLLAFFSQKDYQQLKSRGEKFLMTYPDYRMIETVENWYEKALAEIAGEN